MGNVLRNVAGGLLLLINFTMSFVELGITCLLGWFFLKAGLFWFIGYVIVYSILRPWKRALESIFLIGPISVYIIQAFLAYSLGHFILLNFGVVIIPVQLFRGLLCWISVPLLPNQDNTAGDESAYSAI